jgi:lipopolysaccharide transport system ATP-binding protein
MPEVKNYYCLGHHKCATNWLRGIFQTASKTLGLNYMTVGGNVMKIEVPEAIGMVTLNVNATTKYLKTISPVSKGIHLIRDPRDALVSDYWSTKVSHGNNSAVRLEMRTALQDLDTEQGLIKMMELFAFGDQMKGWKRGEQPNILDEKYEDMLTDTHGSLCRWFDFLDIDASDILIKEIIEKTAFTRLTKGREQGDEDVTSHYRKGVAGDWKNCFTPVVKEKFKSLYGDILVEWDYEEDQNW